VSWNSILVRILERSPNFPSSGFGLTIGSDIYFLLDPRARHAQIAATALLDKVIIHGSFVADNTTQPTGFAGTFSFTNSTGGRDMTNWVEGCYRDPSWPWYFQPFPFWTLFILVPAYSLFSSSWNLQPFRSKQLPIMVAISCCSFAGQSNYMTVLSQVDTCFGSKQSSKSLHLQPQRCC